MTTAPNMQRRHLEKIAETIRDLQYTQGTRIRNEIAEFFAERFENDNVCGYDNNGNRKFRRECFLRACGVED